MAEFVVIATWPFGQTAVKAAAALLADGKPALDAAIAGGQAVEDDPTVHSVGYGGLGNAIGTVQLDACVMDGKTLDCGGVAAPGERPPRRRRGPPRDGEDAARPAGRRGGAAVRPAAGLPAGDAADAGERGRMGEEAAQAAKPPRRPAELPGHDTVTVLALDQKGSLGGVCTTSGLAHKLPGRVGDSPLIGAGLYVDNDGGGGRRPPASARRSSASAAACSSSRRCGPARRRRRRASWRCAGSIALAVRRGVHPAQVAFLALDPKGRVGAACTAMTNFQYAVARAGGVELLKAKEIGPEGE